MKFWRLDCYKDGPFNVIEEVIDLETNDTIYTMHDELRGRHRISRIFDNVDGTTLFDAYVIDDSFTGVIIFNREGFVRPYFYHPSIYGCFASDRQEEWFELLSEDEKQQAIFNLDIWRHWEDMEAGK